MGIIESLKKDWVINITNDVRQELIERGAKPKHKSYNTVMREVFAKEKKCDSTIEKLQEENEVLRSKVERISDIQDRVLDMATRMVGDESKG